MIRQNSTTLPYLTILFFVHFSEYFILFHNKILVFVAHHTRVASKYRTASTLKHNVCLSLDFRLETLETPTLLEIKKLALCIISFQIDRLCRKLNPIRVSYKIFKTCILSETELLRTYANDQLNRKLFPQLDMYADFLLESDRHEILTSMWLKALSFFAWYIMDGSFGIMELIMFNKNK